MVASNPRRQPAPAFTLIELLVVVSIVAFLISILLPALSRAREMSRRLVCAANVKGLGAAMMVYANDHRESWPLPGFSEISRGDPAHQVRYLRYNRSYGGVGDPDNPDRRRAPSQADGRNDQRGSTRLSVTRAFWLLVRSGDVFVKQYICPSSGEGPDQTEDVDAYYDFELYENVSYGMQVPFGPRNTRARSSLGASVPVLADKGPWYYDVPVPDWQGRPLSPESSPADWRFANSPNHGGPGEGQGQNIVFADGHGEFLKTPLAGLEHDNIYTVMADHASDAGRWFGVTPHLLVPFNYGPFPGQNTYGPNVSDYAATDTLIYP